MPSTNALTEIAKTVLRAGEAARDLPKTQTVLDLLNTYCEGDGLHLAVSRAANSRFRSAVYFHHGFFGAPSM